MENDGGLIKLLLRPLVKAFVGIFEYVGTLFRKDEKGKYYRKFFVIAFASIIIISLIYKQIPYPWYPLILFTPLLIILYSVVSWYIRNMSGSRIKNKNLRISICVSSGFFILEVIGGTNIISLLFSSFFLGAITYVILIFINDNVSSM